MYFVSMKIRLYGAVLSVGQPRAWVLCQVAISDFLVY